MHVIVGDGELTKRELSATLEDLLEAAGDEPFWFLIVAKDEPTATDRNLMAWLHEREIYYQVIGSDIKGADPIYEGYQDKYEVKNIGPKLVEVMQTVPDEGEEADVLALFVSDEPDAEEDKWLNSIIEQVLRAEGGFKVKALNDGMTEIGLEGEEEEEEETPPPPAAKKAAPKSTRPLAAVPDPEPDGEETATSAAAGDDGDELLTRAELEAMDLKDVIVYAAKRGLELPPRTRKVTYIERLMGTSEPEPEEEVEVTETSAAVAALANGHVSPDDFAKGVLDAIARIIAAGLEATKAG